MYKEAPAFIPPDDENVKIWRYMDFTKFVSLLDKRSLWFTRADKFKDPFEGSYPKKNVLRRELLPMEIPIEKIPKINLKFRQYVAINCWHINEHESAAMWSLYLKSNEGIAVQSTYKRLRDSFSSSQEEVLIGKVKYIDYETEWFKDDNYHDPFLHKRKSYEHERELRAITIKWPIPEEGGWDLEPSIEIIKAGISVVVDLTGLIERIYVAPEAPAWFTELVQSVTNKYEYDIEVRQSLLNSQPVY